MHLIHLDLDGDLDALIEAGAKSVVEGLVELLRLEAGADDPGSPS
jgi:hypothetical protein